ncbi:Cytochrome oxidase biogenesis protein Sco1/SenC/PrrC, putative copper metallochaperone [Marinobacter nitratireducens]|uniref:Cytochrome oxidase biogenesis protein Sco1/SenC/PrrC, putative copper metallochaperone n=1 Tax=Marinobacter nitratireducens TaxID=1137280 RepID=A0A072N2T0_9GAMM|nr:SCO family protein [Marinobacter nitratireducens]KEF31801.1 Cytochrome oxidase biogenesis protein Sco1/SenC/PrrC, putative copper metallochaperone [Marinobacter nitratireducens]
MRYWLALPFLTLAMSLGGCSGGNETWHAKDISGLMPPLEFELTGTGGNTVTEEDSSGSLRLLYFGFTSCPDVCPTTLTGLRQSIRQLPEPYRDDVTTLFVSVDPERDTPERLQSYVQFFGEGIVGLTGAEDALRRLSKRYRTTFGYDEPDAEGNYNVSHSSAVYVFDRTGEARLLIRPGLTTAQISEDLSQLAR